MIIPDKVVVGGRSWRLFECSFDTVDGESIFFIHAISVEHAVEILEELKRSAKVVQMFPMHAIREPEPAYIFVTDAVTVSFHGTYRR